MRIIFGTNYYDKPYAFQDNSWHFIQACFRKSEVTSDTQLLLWIDDTLGADIQNFDSTFTDSTSYEVYAGRDFAGIMRTLSISEAIDWECTSESSIRSPHIVSNKDYLVAIANNITTVAN